MRIAINYDPLLYKSSTTLVNPQSDVARCKLLVQLTYHAKSINH